MELFLDGKGLAEEEIPSEPGGKDLHQLRNRNGMTPLQAFKKGLTTRPRERGKAVEGLNNYAEEGASVREFPLLPPITITETIRLSMLLLIQIKLFLWKPRT